MKTFRITKSTITPFLPDDSQVNPNTYGFELALWLAQKLAELKIIFSYPTSEDWGWFIEQSDGNRELWICCNGQYDGNALTWSFYLKEQIGLFGRSKYTKDEIQKLEETIVKLIRDNGMVITEEHE